jgi:hypothetical protein
LSPSSLSSFELTALDPQGGMLSSRLCSSSSSGRTNVDVADNDDLDDDLDALADDDDEDDDDDDIPSIDFFFFFEFLFVSFIAFLVVNNGDADSIASTSADANVDASAIFDFFSDDRLDRFQV